MELRQVLQEIGLSQGESDVYLALLKHGESPVSKIRDETRHHRTVIYDFLDHLITKGLASYVLRGNVRYYTAAEPIRLIDFLKEKERQVDQVMEELTALSSHHEDDLKVEIHRGRDGFKSVLRDVLRNKQELTAMGINESKFDALMGNFMDQYFLKQEEAGFSERLITCDGAEFVYDSPTTTYRSIPKEYFHPTATFIYANKVGIMIWAPVTIVLIENKELADAYRKQFEMMWAIAKPFKKLNSQKNKKDGRTK